MEEGDWVLEHWMQRRGGAGCTGLGVLGAGRHGCREEGVLGQWVHRLRVLERWVQRRGGAGCTGLGVLNVRVLGTEGSGSCSPGAGMGAETGAETALVGAAACAGSRLSGSLRGRVLGQPGWVLVAREGPGAGGSSCPSSPSGPAAPGPSLCRQHQSPARAGVWLRQSRCLIRSSKHPPSPNTHPCSCHPPGGERSPRPRAQRSDSPWQGSGNQGRSALPEWWQKDAGGSRDHVWRGGSCWCLTLCRGAPELVVPPGWQPVPLWCCFPTVVWCPCCQRHGGVCHSGSSASVAVAGATVVAVLAAVTALGVHPTWLSAVPSGCLQSGHCLVHRFVLGKV